MKKFLQIIKNGESLSEEQMIEAMSIIMDGEASDDEIEKLVISLSDKGEVVDEITGAARVLRQKATTITAPPGTIDCCGTGGDGANTYNISSAVALVAASCRVPIAKHGGGASTSKSGSVDVFAQLGINLDMTPENLEEALRRFNFTFLAAPRHHSAMKNVRAVRRKIGRRTIFNLLGPLTNPAGTEYQLIGVFSKQWLVPIAEALRQLGTKRAWVVHGADGLDEITTTAATHVVILEEDGQITETEITPEDFGLPYANPEDLKGGNAEENAAALYKLLEGQKSAYRDIVLANTSAVLCIHGSAQNLKEGVQTAAQAIDSGKALQTLESYINFTKGT